MLMLTIYHLSVFFNAFSEVPPPDVLSSKNISDLTSQKRCVFGTEGVAPHHTSCWFEDLKEFLDNPQAPALSCSKCVHVL